MEQKDGKGASLAGGLVLFGVGAVSVGYDLAKVINDLDGAGPLLGVGAMCCGLGSMFIGKATSGKV